MKSLVKKWLEVKELNEGKSPQTTKKYGYYLSLLSAYCDEHGLDPLNICRKDLESFVGMYLHKRQLAPRSRRTAVAAVKGFYAWAFDNGHTSNDPAGKLPYPIGIRSLPVAMGLKHFESLLQDCDLDTFLGVRDAAIISLLGGCGLRLGGVCGLNMADIFMYEHGDQERLAIKVLEKGNKERMMPIPLEAQLFLRVYLGHPELRSINRKLPNGDEVVFVTTMNRHINDWDYYGDARRMSPRAVQKMIAQRGESAGIPAKQCHPHALRHLTGTEYAEDDLDLLTRQMLLGHADPSATAVYTQLAVRKLTTQVDKANPLSKVRTQVTPLISALQK